MTWGLNEGDFSDTAYEVHVVEDCRGRCVVQPFGGAPSVLWVRTVSPDPACAGMDNRLLDSTWSCLNILLKLAARWSSSRARPILELADI